jgi:hypothetical protein
MTVTRLPVGFNRAGAKREAKVAARAKAAAPATTAAEKKPLKISDTVIEHARRLRPAGASKKAAGFAGTNPFQPFEPPPGVLPKNTKPMALDEALGSTAFAGLMQWGGGDGALFEEGIGFIGYSYLAQLTQRPEYRRISERIATEMTRKWIKLNVVSATSADTGETDQQLTEETAGADPLDDEAGEGPEAAAATAAEQKQADRDRVQKSVAAKASAEKAKRIKELEDAMRKFKLKDAFYNIAEGDGWFGRYHLFIDIKPRAGRFFKHDSREADVELKSSIGNGSNATSRGKVHKGSIKAFRCVEPMWCYPATYEAANPLREGFYNPDRWYANGIEVHRSRLMCFVGREVPDILKPAYAFGGLSMSQMAKPYVDNWLRTRQAVADLIESFSVSGVYMNMAGSLQEGGVEALKRIELFNVMRSNAGAFALDKDTEEFFNVSTPLGTLDALQAQSQEQMSSVSGIPLIILLGITPTGLNASSEGEIRAFYDWIHAYQESFFRDQLQACIHFIMLHLWGEIDEEITFEFEPLWSMTDKEKAEIDKIEAETDQVRIDSGVLDPGEVRKAVAAQPDSRYSDINPDDVPEQPTGGSEDPFGGGGDGGGEGGGEEPDRTVATDEAMIEAALAGDEWTEGDHPRADDGKFGSGGGGTTLKSSTAGKSRSTKPGASRSSQSSSYPLNVSKLKKQGGKLGSNEGGVYANDAGEKFYVKKPATKDHVTNEKTAAKLYKLAGVNTLDYREAGPDHVVTAWQDLDKNNISKFSAEEKKAAAADFAVHAWLSNWDAAGTGGDNQGMMAGKPHTLDVGGSLRYRAQGGPKGNAFGDKVTELDTMRDKSMSPDAARLFGSMSDADLKSSIERVTSIPDDKIRSAVGDDKALADRLIARKQDMARRFSIAQDEDADVAIMEAALDQAELVTAPSAGIPIAAMRRRKKKGERAQDILFSPLAGDDDEGMTEVAPDVFAMDEGQFDESKHPRSPDGKFGSGGGSGAAKKEDNSVDELENLLLPGHPDHPDTAALNASKAAASQFKTKKEHIAHLLTNGVTPKELMTTMGWPSVSMPAQAKSLGMKLEKKDGKYFGTKMSAEELAAEKAAQQDKISKQVAEKKQADAGLAAMAGKPAPKLNEAPKPAEGATYTPPKDYPAFLGAIADAVDKKDAYAIEGLLKYNPAWAEKFVDAASPAGKAAIAKVAPGAISEKSKAPKATEAELKKAAKSTTLPISTSAPAGVTLIKEFNDKYAGKNDLTPEQLNQKVQDYKDLTAMLPKVQAEYDSASKAEKAATEKKAVEDAKKKAEAKLAKDKAELQAEFDKDPALKLHYEAAEAMFGGAKASEAYIKSAFNKVKSAGLTKYMTAADAVPIIAYSGSHYVSVNNQLRAGKMTEAQDKFRRSLNAGLDKLPSHNETTYRKASLDSQQSALYEVGYVVEERGFMSTSKNQGTWSGDHNFTVHGKNGKDIQKLSSHPSEAEVLFKSGSRFKVVSRSGNNIVLQEV